MEKTTTHTSGPCTVDSESEKFGSQARFAFVLWFLGFSLDVAQQLLVQTLKGGGLHKKFYRRLRKIGGGVFNHPGPTSFFFSQSALPVYTPPMARDEVPLRTADQLNEPEIPASPVKVPDRRRLWWAELVALMRLAFPIIGTQLLQMALSIITTLAAGRLGVEYLDAASLGTLISNVTGVVWTPG